MEFVIGITVAVVGALGALFTTLLAAHRQRQREYEKEVRLAVADAIHALAALGHSMVWLTWHAKTDPSRVDAEFIATYNQEAHRAIPKTVASLAVVAALRHAMYELLGPTAREAYELDAAIGASAAKYREDPAGSVEGLAALADQATGLTNRFTQTIVAAFGGD